MLHFSLFVSLLNIHTKIESKTSIQFDLENLEYL